MINDSAPMPGQLPRGYWRRSSYSGTSGNCIEVAAPSHRTRAVRDSKDPTGPVLTFTTDQWSAFTAYVRGLRRHGRQSRVNCEGWVDSRAIVSRVHRFRVP
ncbi:MAG: DUF397 domain-containing protein [Pseudonocardiaceae bacterium]